MGCSQSEWVRPACFPPLAICALSSRFAIQAQGECQVKGHSILQMLLAFHFTKERKIEQHHIKLGFHGFHYYFTIKKCYHQPNFSL